MFALRRIAARAVFAQPARQLSSLRPAQSRASIFTSDRATLYRSFHQSRTWLADDQTSAEQAKASPAEAESSSETVTTEPSAEELKDVKEESIATSEVLESAKEQASDAAESAKETAEDAVESAKEKTEDTVEAAKEKTEDAFTQAQEGASSAKETIQNLASTAAETVSSAASSVAQTAQRQIPPRNAPSGPGREKQPSKILYVGNLFFEVTTPQLEAEFTRFGAITNSRVVTDARGLSKGFAYVEFADQESADRAVQEMDQRQFQGRRMAVQYHQRREGRRDGTSAGRTQPNRTVNPPSKTLFIGNMSYQMSDRDLNDLFREIRNVLDVRVAIDRRSGQPRGFAHADFIDIESAERAKAHLEQKVVYGRQLRVDYSASSASTQPSPTQG